MYPALAFLCGVCGLPDRVAFQRNFACRSLRRQRSGCARLAAAPSRVLMMDDSRQTVQGGSFDGDSAVESGKSQAEEQRASGRREASFVEPDADLTELLKNEDAEVESGNFRPDVPLLNSVMLTGRLGQDPVLRRVGSDASRKLALLTFSLAVQDDVPEGDWEPGKERTTSWFNCEMWGQQAESASRVLRKGLRIGVTGQLGFSVYTNREGIEVEAAAVTVSSFEILQSRSEADQAHSASADGGRWRGTGRRGYGGAATGSSGVGYDVASVSESASRSPPPSSYSTEDGSRFVGDNAVRSRPPSQRNEADAGVDDDLPF